MFITFVPEEQSCSVITGTCLQNPGTENGTTTFTLLGYLEILYAISIEKIPNDHFSLGLTVGIGFIWETDVYPHVKEGR